MQLPLRFTEDFLSTLKGRIAIVGNATPQYAFGKIIDSYDHVIRFNNFCIRGFEEVVGTKTSFRCTSGWNDIEHRNDHIEFSPFTAQSVESGNLARFNRVNRRAILAASTDIHERIPETSKPSTGFAFVQLCADLRIAVDLFGFDGFKTAHYWNASGNAFTTHSNQELDFITRRPGVLVFGETYPYERLYDYCHATHTGYDQNAGLELIRWCKKEFHGFAILEFGAGNGQLARHLEEMGNCVTAVEASRVAYDKMTCTTKIHGTALSLLSLRDSFDCFVSVDVLEHLTENDCKIVIREAARLAKRIFVSVSTRPSGLLGPNGENLHLTIKPDAWWVKQFGEFFTVRAYSGFGDRQLVLEGERKSSVESVSTATRENEFYHKLFTESDVWSSPQPNEDETARWNQIERLLVEIPRCPGASIRILDLGCGRGWLTNLLSRYGDVEGVEPVASVVEYARTLFPRLPFSAGDAATILGRADFAPYDLVVSSEVIEHVVDKQAFVAHLKRLVKPDGHVVLTTPRNEALLEWMRHFGQPPQPVEDWISEGQMRDLLTGAGFGAVKCERVWFDLSRRHFVGSSSDSNVSCDELVAIYQVWAFQASMQSVALTSFHFEKEVLRDFYAAYRGAAERSLQSGVEHPTLLAARAEAIFELGEHDRGRAAAVQAVGLYPDSLSARDLCFRILSQLGRDTAAAAHEKRAIELRERSPYIEALLRQLAAQSDELVERHKQLASLTSKLDDRDQQLRNIHRSRAWQVVKAWWKTRNSAFSIVRRGFGRSDSTRERSKAS